VNEVWSVQWWIKNHRFVQKRSAVIFGLRAGKEGRNKSPFVEILETFGYYISKPKSISHGSHDLP